MEKFNDFSVGKINFPVIFYCQMRNCPPSRVLRPKNAIFPIFVENLGRFLFMLAVKWVTMTKGLRKLKGNEGKWLVKMLNLCESVRFPPRLSFRQSVSQSSVPHFPETLFPQTTKLMRLISTLFLIWTFLIWIFSLEQRKQLIAIAIGKASNKPQFEWKIYA